MKNLHFYRLLVAAILLFGLAPICSTANALIIDDFTSFDTNATNDQEDFTFNINGDGWIFYPNVNNSTPGTGTVSESGLSNVIGGTRSSIFWYMDTFGDGMGISTSYQGGAFFFETGPSTTDFNTLNLHYNNGGSGLNADFSGESQVTVTFSSDHFAYLKDSVMSLTLSDSDSSSTVEKRWVHPDDYVSGLGIIDANFSLFDFSGITMNDIQSVNLYFEGDIANDSIFYSIQTQAVPDPGTVWLLGTGLLGIAGLGRKRFKK